MHYSTCARALLLVAAFSAPVARAQAPAGDPQQAPTPAPAWSVGPITFSGLVDAYYSWNANHPSSRVNLYRNFDVKANQFSLNMAKLTMTHDADPVGFTLDLSFGRAYDIFHATEPGGDILDVVPQAFVTFKPAKLNGAQFDFGKFYTSAGAELTETHLNWNYSRALLYANAPYYHAGFRMTQPLGGGWTGGFQLLNGWNNVEDNNSGKTVGFTMAKTGGKVSWFNTYYVGPEKTGTNEGFRHFYDTVVAFTPNSAVNAYVNFDYGTEKLQFGGSNDWIGVAGAARFQVSRNIAITPRLEYYYDKDGFITGASQKLKEFTVTGEYKWAEGLLSRLEYRRDWSDRPVFERGTGGAFMNQTTLLVGVVAFFGPKR